MADSMTSLKRPRRWPRGLMWFGIGFLVLVIVLYFVGTSAAVFKSVILPRVGKSMNATITVSDASISPFSRVVLKDLKVTPNGKETLLTAQEVRARYSLFKIIGGTIKVDEVAVVSPVVEIVTAPDGSSNLDPILASQKDEPKKKKDEKSEPPQVDLKKLALNNAIVRSIKVHANGTRDVAELSNVNITLDDLRNGQTAKFAMTADIKLANNPPAGQQGALQAKLDGTFTAGFSKDLKPTTVQGSSQFNVQGSSGSLAELAGLSAQLNTDITPTEVKQVALQFKKGNTALGEVRAQGPLDLNKMEGQVNVLVLNIDRQVLNLAGAASGMDFGSTVINSTNQIQLAGKTVAALGQVGVTKLSIKRDGQTTPPLDLQLAYNVAVNKSDKSADLRTFTLNGLQQNRSVLKGELTSPMRIAWGGATPNAGDSTFRLVVDSLNLADWKPVIGDIAGKVNLALNLTSQQSGKQLALDVTSQIDNLAMAFGTNKVQNVAVTLRTRGQATDLKKIALPELRLETTHAGQPMLTVAGNVQMDRDAQTTDAQLTLDGAMPAILKTLSRPDANASSGALNGQLRVTQKGQDQTVAGKLALVSFSGQFGEQQFNNFGVNVELDAQKKGAEMELRKLAGTLSGGGRPGGSFDVTGKFNSEKQTSQFDLKLANINENAARPFLEPIFKGKQLASISINGNASGRYNANADASIKADFKVANLAVRDPKKPNPQTPLEAAFKLDATQKKEVVELQKCELTLTPTSRAKNSVQITGRLDRSQTNAMQGNLKVSADSLDVTPYYDLVAGDQQPEEPAVASANQPPPPADANKEPEPTKLPFRNTVADIQVKRLYLREIDIASFTSTVKVDGSLILLKPVQMTINGKPLSASVDLNLGVPGYQYEITCTADGVPVEPLANSLSPDYKGRMKGDLLANVQIKGAGTTGVNLKKTLAGDVGVAITNANIQLVGPRQKTFLGALGGILTTVGRLVGMPDLSKSPVKWLNATMKMGEGKIELAGLTVFSDAFVAESRGVIPIADVLTNSPINNLPVEISLSRAVAERARVLPANTPTNTAYVKLPTLAYVRGTIGDPKTDVKETVIVGLVATSTGRLIPGGSDAGKILQGIGGILTGERNTNRPATNTNAPATNASPLRGLLDLIPKKKKE
jgi:hypothetical protein